MMRLIDADKLDFSFDRRVFGEADENYIRGADDAISAVNNAETVEDFVPVVHGKWEHTHTSESYYTECLRCSVCGTEDTEGYASKFCPNCGARMDG